jgi:hypothetical protein
MRCLCGDKVFQKFEFLQIKKAIFMVNNAFYMKLFLFQECNPNQVCDSTGKAPRCTCAVGEREKVEPVWENISVYALH